VQKILFSEWDKLLKADNWFIWVRLFFMALDAVLFTLSYLYAFQPTFQDPLQAHFYVTVLLFSSVCMGIAVGVFAKERRAKLKEDKEESTFIQ
jgi:hypothetical protein